MALLARGSELGVMKKGEFVSYTNFVFDVVASVEAPPNYPPCSGFIYEIKKSRHEERYYCLSKDDYCVVLIYLTSVLTCLAAWPT